MDTPARRQYLDVKARHPDAILWFRMGDFYETFDRDAEVMAGDLHITLTSREFGRGNRVPMAGVPHHAATSYLRRLLAKGHRVAICEQLSEAGKGLVERGVTRVLTPGTVVEPNLLAARENNYLVALLSGRDGYGLSYVDLSTGEFCLSQFRPDQDAALRSELSRLDPAECLLPEGKEPPVPVDCPLTPCPPRWFRQLGARERLYDRFNVVSLEAFGCALLPLAIGAAGALLAYIESTDRDLARALRPPRAVSPDAHMTLDLVTRRNLDLTRRDRAGNRIGTLLHLLDRTRTPIGGRLLRRWLAAPLLDLQELERRQSVVAVLVADSALRGRLQDALDGAGDLERLASRARQGSASARDLLALAAGLRAAALTGDILAPEGHSEYGSAAGAGDAGPSPETGDDCSGAAAGEIADALSSGVSDGHSSSRTGVGMPERRAEALTDERRQPPTDRGLELRSNGSDAPSCGTLSSVPCGAPVAAEPPLGVSPAGSGRPSSPRRDGPVGEEPAIRVESPAPAPVPESALGGSPAGEGQALRSLLARIDPLVSLAELIERAVDGEGARRIRPGFDAELDAIGEAVNGAQSLLLGLERRLRQETGIRSLKVAFNKVFGYYIEVTRANLSHVPDGFLRRQTLANAERFVTDELRECESAILRAEERIAGLDERVFNAVREQVGGEIGPLLATASALAELDVLAAFAEVAAVRRYTRPALDHSGRLVIEGGRHPVVEASLEEGSFIANDTCLSMAQAVPASNDPIGLPDPGVVEARVERADSASQEMARLLLITGPNMAGKSTYLRQVALIVLMAQVGSFVPAASARIGLVDRIFTRVGAHDDLAAGESTFLVEMVETAAILRQATARSLLIFDEIGRGTSTFDGLSIARAVVEDVHDRIGARTLFATHYHELTSLAARLPALRNANAAVVEDGSRVVFLHRIRPGGADRSYGIHVAAIAGLPEHVTARAKALLAELECPLSSGSDQRVAEEGAVYSAGGALADRSPSAPAEPIATAVITATEAVPATTVVGPTTSVGGRAHDVAIAVAGYAHADQSSVRDAADWTGPSVMAHSPDRRTVVTPPIEGEPEGALFLPSYQPEAIAAAPARAGGDSRGAVKPGAADRRHEPFAPGSHVLTVRYTAATQPDDRAAVHSSSTSPDRSATSKAEHAPEECIAAERRACPAALDEWAPASPTSSERPVLGAALLAELRDLDLARMTPLAALNTLATLQEQAIAAAAPPEPLRLLTSVPVESPTAGRATLRP